MDVVLAEIQAQGKIKSIRNLVCYNFCSWNRKNSPMPFPLNTVLSYPAKDTWLGISLQNRESHLVNCLPNFVTEPKADQLRLL